VGAGDDHPGDGVVAAQSLDARHAAQAGRELRAACTMSDFAATGLPLPISIPKQLLVWA
jgi:hypothetical protein